MDAIGRAYKATEFASVYVIPWMPMCIQGVALFVVSDATGRYHIALAPTGCVIRKLPEVSLVLTKYPHFTHPALAPARGSNLSPTDRLPEASSLLRGELR